MDEETDDTATIDLAIAFFCSVLVLFVFVAFNLDSTPDDPTQVTIGQRQLNVTVEPPTWSAIRERGSFAIWHDDQLHILNLSTIALGVVSVTDGYSGADAAILSSMRNEPAPHAFSLSISINLAQMPEELIADVANAESCPTNTRNFVTVFIDPDQKDLSRLLELANRCSLRFRLAYNATVSADGWLSTRLGLSQSAYTNERIFR